MGGLEAGEGWKGSGRGQRERETTKVEKHKSAKTMFWSDVLLNIEKHTLLRDPKPV